MIMEASAICERCNIFTTNIACNFSCNHSLCSKCVTRIIAFSHIKSVLTQDQIEIACPCQKRTKVITVSDLPQLLENVNVISTCQTHKAAATFHCLTCDVGLCEDCLEMHSDHQITQDQRNFRKCEIHEGVVKDLICHDCHEMICLECTSNEAVHSTHNFQLIKDYANELMKQIPICDVSTQVQRIDKVRRDFSRQVDKAYEKTIQKMDELVKQIEEFKIIYKEKMKQTFERAAIFLYLLKFCYLDYNKSNETLDIHLLKDLTNWNKDAQHLELTNTKKKIKKIEEFKEFLKMPPVEPIQVRDWKVLSERIQNTLTLTGHSSHVSSLIQLEDGRIASGSYDKTIKIWEMKGNEFINSLTLSGHSFPVRSLLELEDGRIASGSADKTIKIWDVKGNEGKNTLTLTGHTGYIYSLILLEDGRIASASADKTIKLWEVKENELKNTLTLTGHTKSVWALIQLADGRIASGSDDKTIKIWEVNQREFKNIITLTGHKGFVYSLIQLEDGRIASGSCDTTIKVWEVIENEFQNTLTLTGHTGYIYSLIQLEDGRIASGSDDKTIKLWEVKENEFENTLTLTGHKSIVYSVIQLEDGRIASGSDDKTIKIWE